MLENRIGGSPVPKKKAMTAISNWQTPAAGKYGRAYFSVNVIDDNSIHCPELRCDVKAVESLIRIIRSYPVSESHSDSAKVDEHIYSMF